LLKIKGRDIYIPPLTGKPWPAAVYNSNWRTDRQWHKWRGASSGSPLPEWTDCECLFHVKKADRAAYNVWNSCRTEPPKMPRLE